MYYVLWYLHKELVMSCVLSFHWMYLQKSNHSCLFKVPVLVHGVLKGSLKN